MAQVINYFWIPRGYDIEIVCDNNTVSYRQLLDSGRVRITQNVQRMVFGGALSDVLPSNWLYRSPYTDTNSEEEK